MLVIYSTFNFGAPKPNAATDSHKIGYMHITEITCADISTGIAHPDRAGYVKFDMFWSRKIND